MKAMAQRVQGAWQQASVRERRLMLAAVLVVGVAAVLLSVESLMAQQQRLDAALPLRRAELTQMQADAAALSRLNEAARPADVSLATRQRTLEAMAASRGLTLSVTVVGDRLQVGGEGAPAAWLDWLAEVQRQTHLRPVRLTLAMAGGSARLDAELQP